MEKTLALKVKKTHKPSTTTTCTTTTPTTNNYTATQLTSCRSHYTPGATERAKIGLLYLLVCLSVCLCFYLSIYLSPYFYLSLYLSIYLYLFHGLSIYLSNGPFFIFYLSIYLYLLIHTVIVQRMRMTRYMMCHMPDLEVMMMRRRRRMMMIVVVANFQSFFWHSLEQVLRETCSFELFVTLGEQ